MLQGCPSETPHGASKSKFGGIVLWRSRLVDVSCETALKDKARISARVGGFELLSKVEERQLNGIHDSSQVDVENFEVWLCRFRFRV
jgi:hypothetical protein